MAEKPSRPLTAYNIFFHDERQRLHQAYLDGTSRKLSYQETSRVVAARWRRLESQEKAYYKQLAAKDKRRFALEMVQWKIEQESATIPEEIEACSTEPKENNAQEPAVQASHFKEQRKQEQDTTQTSHSGEAQLADLDNRGKQDQASVSAIEIAAILNSTPNAAQKLRILLQMMDMFFHSGNGTNVRQETHTSMHAQHHEIYQTCAAAPLNRGNPESIQHQLLEENGAEEDMMNRFYPIDKPDLEYF